MKRLISIILIAAVVLSAMPVVFAAETNDSELEMGKGVSIMCVGESTTYGNGTVSAYRGHLYRMYKEAGIKANFIGPISEKNGDLPIGSGHAGIGGLYIREVAQRVNPWLECYKPQVVFLTIGGNDTSQGKADKFPEDTRETAPDRLKALVEQILVQHPTAQLYVATITPSNSGYNKFRTAYNEGIEPIVNEIAETHTNVHFIDIGSSITDFSTDLQSDGLHPTEAGYEKMAKAWFDGTKDMISSLPLSNPLKLTRTPSTGDYMAQMQSKGEVKYPSISSNSVTIEANTDYVAQIQLKGESGVTALIKINTTVDGSWKQIAQLGATPGPDWSTYTINFNSGEYTTAFLAIMDNSKVAGKVYIDDAVLYKASDEKQTNLIKNPSFENQKANWSLNSIFSIVRSGEIIDPPLAVKKDLAVVDTLTMDFEELAADSRPTDIDCHLYNGNSAYNTNPYEDTTDKVSNKAGMFYVDTDGHRYISLNPINSYQTAKFIFTRGGYQTLTGFDEMRIKLKMVQKTGVDYTDKTTANYPLKVSLSDLLNSSTATGSSAEVFIYPSQFGATETITITKEQLTGGTLDMNGKLDKYTDDKGQHQVQLTLLPKGGVGTMIDEIEFVWREDDKVLEYKSIAFENDGQSANALGIVEGTTTVKATLYNAGTNSYDNAVFCVAMYNKTTNKLVDMDIFPIKAATDETIYADADVTLPQGAKASQHLIKVFLWEDGDICAPITNVFEFDVNGAVGQ